MSLEADFLLEDVVSSTAGGRLRGGRKEEEISYADHDIRLHEKERDDLIFLLLHASSYVLFGGGQKRGPPNSMRSSCSRCTQALRLSAAGEKKSIAVRGLQVEERDCDLCRRRLHQP